MHGCMLKIKESISHLTPSEQKVAGYILKNPEESVGLSVVELADRSGASKAAIIRFCKSLDFDGYREFSIKMASDMAVSKENEQDSGYTDIQVGDDLETLIKNVSLNSKKAIDDTLEVLDFEEVRKAIELLRKAGRIDFYGVGASGIIAQDAQQKFLRINRQTNAFADPHLQATAATLLSPGDAAVFISYSGETRDIIETLDFARGAGAATIAVTKYGNSSLSERADICLHISSPETSMRSAAGSSRIAQLNIIDILFTGIATLDYPEIKQYLDRTRTIRARKRLS